MTANQVQDKIIRDFQALGDWFSQYAYLIEMAGTMEELDPKYKTDENLVEGCQSKVWLVSFDQDGRIKFQVDSSALIVKGIMAVLLKIYCNRTPQEILNTQLYFVEKTGLKQHLSGNRSEGIQAVIQKIREIAQMTSLGTMREKLC